MQERLESLFGQAQPGWVPPADLCELPDRYVLSIELPGLQRSDVSLDYRDNALVLRGRRPGQTCCPERYQQLERGQGQFCRSFRFSHPVAADRIGADLVDGVLTIVIPKVEPEVSRVNVE
jgi:HSP20 family protein